ncbi:Uu.00g075490.m01.CDS01 [Anthostomella pinea]|uniref:Uu.00g075490.m01.CDS01 n=1 Tax=Anthostomella pinea TaxID=933095 RepID=A0AAI8VWE6_9PEZI|nr:Uu.00g075490.m01.CDS01 [Anthostomella pinea]
MGELPSIKLNNVEVFRQNAHFNYNSQQLSQDYYSTPNHDQGQLLAFDAATSSGLAGFEYNDSYAVNPQDFVLPYMNNNHNSFSSGGGSGYGHGSASAIDSGYSQHSSGGGSGYCQGTEYDPNLGTYPPVEDTLSLLQLNYSSQASPMQGSDLSPFYPQSESYAGGQGHLFGSSSAVPGKMGAPAQYVPLPSQWLNTFGTGEANGRSGSRSVAPDVGSATGFMESTTTTALTSPSQSSATFQQTRAAAANFSTPGSPLPWLNRQWLPRSLLLDRGTITGSKPIKADV